MPAARKKGRASAKKKQAEMLTEIAAALPEPRPEPAPARFDVTAKLREVGFEQELLASPPSDYVAPTTGRSVLRDKTGRVDWERMSELVPNLGSRLMPSGSTVDQAIDDWVSEMMGTYGEMPSRITEEAKEAEPTEPADEPQAPPDKQRQEDEGPSEFKDPCDEILDALRDLSNDPSNQEKRNKVANLMRTLAGATMTHFSLGGSWLDKATRLTNGNFTINDRSIQELWNEAIEICGVVERIATRSGTSISDIMEQGKKAGHRKTTLKETTDKSVGLVKPKAPVFDPRLEPFADIPTASFPKVDPMAGFRMPSALEPIVLPPRVGATARQRTKPGRETAHDTYLMARGRAESYSDTALKDPKVRADYLKYVAEANKLSSEYDFPAVIAKLAAGKDVRKDTVQLLKHQNSQNTAANNRLKKDIRKGTKRVGGVKKTIEKNLKKAGKKNAAAQKKLGAANTANRKRDVKGQKRKSTTTLQDIANTAQAAVDKLRAESQQNSQELQSLGRQAQASDRVKIKLASQAKDIKHDLKMADREMDIGDARHRRIDMETAVGRRMISSLSERDMGPSMAEEMGLTQLGKRSQRQLHAPKTKGTKRGKMMTPESVLAQEAEKASALLKRQTEQAIASEKADAAIDFKQKRQDERSRTKRSKEYQAAQAQASKLEKWAASEWETNMGLHLAPSATFEFKGSPGPVDVAEAQKHTASQWEAKIKAVDKKLRDIKKDGYQARKAYKDIIGEPKSISKGQKSLLVKDLMPHETSLPSLRRSKLDRSFVPEMKIKYPAADWKDNWEPKGSHTYDRPTAKHMKQLIGQAETGTLKLTPENNLLLLEVMGYPKEVIQQVRQEINTAAQKLGDIQKNFLSEAQVLSQAKAALKKRKSLDKIDAKKSKVQKLKKRGTSAPPDRGPARSPSPSPPPRRISRGRSKSPEVRRDRSPQRAPEAPRREREKPRPRAVVPASTRTVAPSKRAVRPRSRTGDVREKPAKKGKTIVI
jgi:hypothetical protein